MNPHLSPEQIANWTLGEREADVEQHLSDCLSCREEAASFKTSLLSFRESTHTWAHQQCTPDDQTIQLIRQAPYRALINRMSLTAIAALLCVLALLTIERRRDVPEAAESKIEDSVLLQSVKQDLSETLPRSLAPLRNVVSWERAEVAVTR